MDLGLKGKRALVMGASSGLGFAIARELAREGATVAISSRSEERLRAAAVETGASAIFASDTSKPGEGRLLIERVAAKLGGLDILVTNTGGPPKGPFVSLSEDQWRDGFQSLWLNAVETMRAAIPLMQQNRFGRILLITSAAAREPMSHMNVSNGLRAGLLGLAKSISNEVAGSGITVNCLLPGYTRTERLNELKIPEEKITSQIPAGRLGEPDELAAMVAFLASTRAAYVSGQAIAVDGGYLHGY